MFKLIGFYLNENQKTYIDMVLDSCDGISQKESQSSIDNSLFFIIFKLLFIDPIYWTKLKVNESKFRYDSCGSK